MKKSLKVIIAVAMAVFIGLTIWAVTSIPEPPDATEVTEHVMTYNDNKITATKSGKVIWELSADSIEAVLESKVARLKNVKCKYNTEDNQVIDLTGDEAVYYETTGDIELKGNIKAHSTDGYEMSCDKTEWVAKESKMLLTGNVTLENREKGISATGDKAEATDGMNKVKLSGKAHIVAGKSITDKVDVQ